MLNVLVCIKLTVDVAMMRPAPDGTPRLDVPWRISPFDEHALELAATLAAEHNATVTALALLPAEPPRELVLRLLASGADNAVLVVDRDWAESDALVKADVLAAALRELEPDLVLCGEASADTYDAQIGPRLAAALALPCAAWCSRVVLEGRTVTADRALDDCVETVVMELPAVVTVGQEINEPRLPSVLQILGAGRKPVQTWTRQRLHVPERATVATLSVVAPPDVRRRIQFHTQKQAVAEVARALVLALGQDGALEEP